MFYIKELFFRAKYFFVSNIFLFIVIFNYKHLLLLIICFSVLNINSLQKAYSLDSFMCTHPFELLIVHLFMVFFFSLFFLIFYSSWIILDFLKGSLKINEFKILNRFFNFSKIFIFVVNLLSFYVLLPIIWDLFLKFHYSLNDVEVFSFSFNLKLYDFFLFIREFIKIICIFNMLGIFTYIFIINKGIIPLISNKKIMLLINIVFSTFLSPPDIFCQILIFIILTISQELLKFSCILHIKFSKLNYLLRDLNPHSYRERVMSEPIRRKK